MQGSRRPPFPDLAVPLSLAALCPDRPLSVKKIAQEDVKAMTDLLEEVPPPNPEPATLSQALVCLCPGGVGAYFLPL